MLTQARAEARRAGTALRLPAGCCCCLSCRQHFTAFLPCPTERMLPTRHWCRMGGGGGEVVRNLNYFRSSIWLMTLWASKPLLIDLFTDDFLLTNLTKLSQLTGHSLLARAGHESLFFFHASPRQFVLLTWCLSPQCFFNLLSPMGVTRHHFFKHIKNNVLRIFSYKHVSCCIVAQW